MTSFPVSVNGLKEVRAPSEPQQKVKMQSRQLLAPQGAAAPPRLFVRAAKLKPLRHPKPAQYTQSLSEPDASTARPIEQVRKSSQLLPTVGIPLRKEICAVPRAAQRVHIASARHNLDEYSGNTF